MKNKPWSNLARVVYKRTYSRNDTGISENWEDTVNRVIAGNTRNHDVSAKEKQRLKFMMMNRKAIPAGRGLWYSGSPGHDKLGGVANNNCWFITLDDWYNYIIAQDLLMLGGGVGASVEHRFVSKLPMVRKNVTIIHKPTKDADFIVPDSREGWNELTYRILESFFVTGKSFTYSTICVRALGEPIKGFGGIASGALPLIAFVEKLCAVLINRQGCKVRPIDAVDVLCSIGELVVSGNVRRSALILMGDPFDKDYLKAKRWDLGGIPTQRAMANFSVVCDDVEDLHPLFWATYENGEPFGIINRTNIRKYGRMGELKKDSAMGVNPCVPAGTEILTKNGYIAIDKIVSQEVEVWNGKRWSLVTPRITGENQPLVKVLLSNGQELTCTLAHEFIISTDYRGGEKRVKASDLQIGDKLQKFNYPIVNSGIYAKQAYSQGFLSAEGMDGYDHAAVYEPKHCCISRLLGHTKTGIPDKYGRINIWWDFQTKPKTFVPHGWDMESRLEWFAGLLDGDGCVLKEGGIQIASVEKAFLLQVQKMLTTLGVASKVTKGQDANSRLMPDGRGGHKNYNCQEIWRLLISSQPIQDLLFLGLKCSRLLLGATPNRDATRFPTVVEVVDAGTADVVYCFTDNHNHTGCFEGIVTGQCGEATLENAEPCNLQELALSNFSSVEELEEGARLMHRYGKRVTCDPYHQPKCDEVVKRNRRIGTGITGCLAAPQFFNPPVLDRVYGAIQDENVNYSKELGVPESIRTTVIKPSGSVSKLLDVLMEGIHSGFSRYTIQRIRFAANDAMIPKLREAGHKMEPVIRFDNTLDHNTLVVDFYIRIPDELPVADEGFDTWKQLEAVKMAQKHWADQSISVTVYYRKSEIQLIKDWLRDNLKEIKTISFLCHNDHGFIQAPKEKITQEQYEELSKNIKDLDTDDVASGAELGDLECAGGACPIK